MCIPQKTEVRFLEPTRIFQFLGQLVKNMIHLKGTPIILSSQTLSEQSYTPQSLILSSDQKKSTHSLSSSILAWRL